MIQYALPYSSHHLDLSQLIPHFFLFRPHIRLHSSLPHFSALIPARQWHPQAHLTRQLSGPGLITGRSSAGKVRYLAALTSWRGIYADDDSYCPLAILLLPLCQSAQSPDIGSIRISLWSTVFFFSLAQSHFLSSKDFWVIGHWLLSPLLFGKSLESQQTKRLETESSGLITLIFGCPSVFWKMLHVSILRSLITTLSLSGLCCKVRSEVSECFRVLGRKETPRLEQTCIWSLADSLCVGCGKIITSKNPQII